MLRGLTTYTQLSIAFNLAPGVLAKALAFPDPTFKGLADITGWDRKPDPGARQRVLAAGRKPGGTLSPG